MADFEVPGPAGWVGRFTPPRYTATIKRLAALDHWAARLGLDDALARATWLRLAAADLDGLPQQSGRLLEAVGGSRHRLERLLKQAECEKLIRRRPARHDARQTEIILTGLGRQFVCGALDALIAVGVLAVDHD